MRILPLYYVVLSLVALQLYAMPEEAPLQLLFDSSDGRPSGEYSRHNLSDVWMYFFNYGLYSNLVWPGGLNSSYLSTASIVASAHGEVVPGGVPGSYVSTSMYGISAYEFIPTEGYPMFKATPGETADEESTWGEDDWYEWNIDPLGVRTFQRAYSWSTPGYSQFAVNDITVTHLSEYGNPGVPLDAFCFSIMGDCDVASADPEKYFYIDDMVYYDGHAIWCNDPDATFDYEFDSGMKASQTDIFVYQRNPDASWSNPEDDIYYHYNYSGVDGIIDADINSDGVSDHFTILFKVVDGDTVYTAEANTGLELFSDGRPPGFWKHTVGDTTYAVVPRNMSYMWDGDLPTSSTDDSGEPTISPPCNGFVGWRLLDLWIKKADGSIERPIDVFGCPIPLSHSWWNANGIPSDDDVLYNYQWGENQYFSGRQSGPAYLAGWIGDPSAPDAFQPANPGPFPIVHDNPIAMGFQPYDYQFLMSFGPVDLADGDSLHIVGGWVIGRGLEGLRRQADNMLDAYYRNGGWGVPDVPPVPAFFYETTGGTVDMIWSDDAETYEPFGGYHIYRSVFNTTAWELIGELESGTYRFTDSTVTGGFPYFYALSAYDGETGIESRQTNYKKALDGTPIPIIPGWAADQDWTENVRVVPNPYRGSAEWELPYANKIAFTNLPPMCDIRIYTLSGDHVETLQHRSHGDDVGEEYWDLTNADGRLVCTGLYVYCVQTSDDHVISKFAIIR